jgi:hypothetical protein
MRNPFAMKKYDIRFAWLQEHSNSYTCTGLDLEDAIRRAKKKLGVPSSSHLVRFAKRGTIRLSDVGGTYARYHKKGKDEVPRWDTSSGYFRIVSAMENAEARKFWVAAVHRGQKIERRAR